MIIDSVRGSYRNGNNMGNNVLDAKFLPTSGHMTGLRQLGTRHISSFDFLCINVSIQHRKKHTYIYIYMHMYSGWYIHIMDIYIYILDVISRIGIYILDLGNLGTNVANGSIRILTLDITSRINIQIWVIWVPMLQMDRSEY